MGYAVMHIPLFFFYRPMHDVVPSAVTIAVAILAIICTSDSYIANGVG
jgi:hypothetical protein